MHASATRIYRGRHTLKLILSEESRAGAGTPVPGSKGPPSARTAAPFYGPFDDEKMSPREALGLILGVSLSVWAVGLALFVVSL
jgi:hypothetical protein